MADDLTRNGKPLLVLVAGAPGAGKTVLAARLGPMLGLPVIGKDILKETLADVLGTGSIEQSQRLGLAAIRVMYTIALDLLGAGVGLIVESNFRPGLAEGDLAPLLERSRAVSLFCQAPTHVCLTRYAGRALSPERHAVHLDRERIEAATPDSLAASWASYAPLDLGVPGLIVDTTAGYVPSLEVVAGWARRAAR